MPFLLNQKWLFLITVVRNIWVQPMDFVLALEENVLAQNLRSITATLNFIKGLFLLMETGLRKEYLFLLRPIFYRRCCCVYQSTGRYFDGTHWWVRILLLPKFNMRKPQSQNLSSKLDLVGFLLLDPTCCYFRVMSIRELPQPLAIIHKHLLAWLKVLFLPHFF